MIRLRTRQRADNEVEIGGRKPRPTIRSNHRDFIVGNSRSDGKHLLDSFSCIHAFLIQRTRIGHKLFQPMEELLGDRRTSLRLVSRELYPQVA